MVNASRRSLALMTVVMLSGCGGSSSGPEKSAQGVKLDDYQRKMMSAIKEARITPRYCGGAYFRSADPLSYNSNLEPAAELHALDMAGNDYVSQVGSNGIGLAGRLAQTIYPYSYAGENILGGSESVKETVQAWLDDPRYCRHIMDPAFDDFAVYRTLVQDATHPAYWSAVFATVR